MRSFAILALSFLPALAACPPKKVEEPHVPSVDRDIAALVMPATDQDRPAIEAALASLEQASSAGDDKAAWARIHYLMDLFDDARFRRHDASLALLMHALGTPDEVARGPEATDRALASITALVDDLFARDRMHPHVQHALTLLDFDSRPPLSRVGLAARMAELEAIGKGRGPLADNARLRMVGYCRRALSDIATVAYARRHEVLAHCLYPLYRSDPAPYFALRADDRPPTPAWRDIVDQARDLAGTVARSRGRLAAAGAYMSALVAEVAEAHAADMPELPELESLSLPRATRAATLYDWAPFFHLVGDAGGLATLSDTEAITRMIAGDGRRTAAIALARSAPATLVLEAARALGRAGADRLELAVLTTQYMKVPRGDYWYGRLADNTATRLGVIPLALAPILGQAKARTESWDPSRSRLGLYLDISQGKWTLLSATGIVATIPAESAEHAQQTLRGVLSWLYAAFPDEDALHIVPGAGATVTDLVAAIEAARHDDQGRELMAVLALAERAPKPTESTLADRIERRSKAAVEIEPTALAIRASVVRACYQEVLDKRPKAKGSFRLELHGAEVKVVQGPKDADLRACLSTGLAPLMKEQNMASAQVTLVAE